MDTAPLLTRREMLRTMGAGMGAVGLATMLADLAPAAAASPGRLADSPMAPRPTHFAPRAKSVIHLFMNGGPSQVDTFDPKPMLAKYHGQTPPGLPDTSRKFGSLMASPWKFRHCGQSGLEVSELYPHVGKIVDDLCIIRSMHTNIPDHEPALLIMNSGEAQPIRPSMGSWITYGLGSENQNLPGFVVLCPGKPVVGPQLWSNSFLPGIFQGTHINHSKIDPKTILPHLSNAHLSASAQRRQLDLLQRLNQEHLARSAGDAQLEARIQSLEMAFRMQFEAQEAFDLQRESAPTRALYGAGDFANGCLLARRLVERGVRIVQLYFGNGQPWDDHNDIGNHQKHALASDQAIAALLTDLKARGLFDETLVLWGGEFGRTPAAQGAKGREHNAVGFSVWLAGGGVKGGIAYGQTDEFGFAAVENKVHVHDLHATLLHLLGIDHTKLTYRYSGRDFRLTDVHGDIVTGILA